jgi:hypothetical protein
MILAETALRGYNLEATDGELGVIKDCLFDDRYWNLRWFVVDTGPWLIGRKILIHPSAVTHVDLESEKIFVNLTKRQIEDSPSATTDEPVSREWQNNLYDYYGWDSMWGNASYYIGYPDIPLARGGPLTLGGETSDLHVPGSEHEYGLDAGDPHLRSANALRGYHVDATDGAIGHVGNFLFDDESWTIRYIVVDTKVWWFGQQVLLSPVGVRDIAAVDHAIHVKISREQVKSSPPWDPSEQIHQDYERRLQQHYEWADRG